MIVSRRGRSSPATWSAWTCPPKSKLVESSQVSQVKHHLVPVIPSISWCLLSSTGCSETWIVSVKATDSLTGGATGGTTGGVPPLCAREALSRCFFPGLPTKVQSRDVRSQSWHGCPGSGMLQSTLRARHRSHGRCDLERYRREPATARALGCGCDGGVVLGWVSYWSIT